MPTSNSTESENAEIPVEIPTQSNDNTTISNPSKNSNSSNNNNHSSYLDMVFRQPSGLGNRRFERVSGEKEVTEKFTNFADQSHKPRTIRDSLDTTGNTSKVCQRIMSYEGTPTNSHEKSTYPLCPESQNHEKPVPTVAARPASTELLDNGCPAQPIALPGRGRKEAWHTTSPCAAYRLNTNNSAWTDNPFQLLRPDQSDRSYEVSIYIINGMYLEFKRADI